MELLDISEKHSMTREEAAAYLRELADSLARHNDIEFEREGLKFRVNVPRQVTVEVELELEDKESSIEIEISW